MAIAKVAHLGATVTLTALGGSATSAEVECIKADYDFDWGEFGVNETMCHKTGTVYDKERYPKFGTRTLETWFDGDKSDAFQALAYDALYGNGDFDVDTATGSQDLEVTIAFTDANSTVVKFNAQMTKIVSKVQLNGYVDFVMTLQQISKPIVT